ncbi:MAG TPA: Smr/MutS family protein [Leptospiraceae bacterium]|nr:Smr/MutS family protein [Leptospiraceae bacterium]HMW05592.1 Smr/MutS family protein [Leptospiraceae bacterium]HMX33551.1 Smr/MutS family protein [Leptospiraceae bacterium]HMY31102.1 Smr/MutS family protein [Leptospiraceae bacterium]HMZ63684.1 Smr/MutS family protein [Leptospiraceae bacterium]
MIEIYIRKMRYEEAKQKLERELQDAFMRGETLVQVVHGIGEGKLKELTLETIRNYDYLRLVNTEQFITPNPGVTKIEIMGLDKQDLKKYIR